VFLKKFHIDIRHLFPDQSQDKERRRKERMMSRFFIYFPYKWFRRTQYITPIGLFYKNVGILLGGCLTREEIVGSYLEGV